MDLSASRRQRAGSARALLVVALVLVWLAPEQAAAHAALVSSDPREGATLAAAPSNLVLTFDEPIGAPAYVVVTAPDGTRADVGAAEPDGGTVTQRLRAAAPTEQSGRWTDGHPVSGQLSFTVAGKGSDKGSGGAAVAPSASAAPGDQESPWRENAGTLSLGMGAVLAAALLLWWPRGSRRGA